MVLPEVGGLLRCPIMTLERVRICKRDGQLINGPEKAREVDDHGFPLWQRLTVYTSEVPRYDGQPIHRAIVRRLRSAGISSATTHRGIWGSSPARPYARCEERLPHVASEASCEVVMLPRDEILIT
jgi:hypothetical protein